MYTCTSQSESIYAGEKCHIVAHAREQNKMSRKRSNSCCLKSSRNKKRVLLTNFVQKLWGHCLWMRQFNQKAPFLLLSN